MKVNLMVEEQTNSASDLLFDLTDRVRGLEGKYNLLRDRVLIINNNMVEEYKKVMAEFKAINTDLKEIKEETFKLKESIRHLLKELEGFARKEDVRFLEKYINLWNPMKFVTESDVINLIERHKKDNIEIKDSKGKRGKK